MSDKNTPHGQHSLQHASVGGGIARLLVSCPDRRGIIAGVSSAVMQAGGNVLDADQHADPSDGRFSMRIAFEGDVDRAGLTGRLDAMDLRYRLRWPGPLPRVAVLCGKQTHCAADLLWRASIGELSAEITGVISNHPDAEPFARTFGHAYDLLPVEPGQKAAQEVRLAGLLDAQKPDLVVLARYMQILSPALVQRFAGRLINIHHSFLPAFAGAKPYHRAFERGVKIIGATAHYVTADLDEGPIIAQGTARISHRDTVEDLIRKGRDLERVVLADAVRLHLEDRVMIDGHRTIVFA